MKYSLQNINGSSPYHYSNLYIYHYYPIIILKFFFINHNA